MYSMLEKDFKAHITLRLNLISTLFLQYGFSKQKLFRYKYAKLIIQMSRSIYFQSEIDGKPNKSDVLGL